MLVAGSFCASTCTSCQNFPIFVPFYQKSPGVIRISMKGGVLGWLFSPWLYGTLFCEGLFLLKIPCYCMCLSWWEHDDFQPFPAVRGTIKCIFMIIGSCVFFLDILKNSEFILITRFRKCAASEWKIFQYLSLDFVLNLIFKASLQAILSLNLT